MAFLAGSFLGALTAVSKVRGKPVLPSDLMMNVLFFLTFVAYVVWLHPILLNPSMIYQMVISNELSPTMFKRDHGTIPGVTTFSQAGAVFSVCYGIRVLNHGVFGESRSINLMMIAVVLFTVLRTVVWSERLAIFEVIIPLVVLWSVSVRKKKSGVLGQIYRVCGRLGPWAAIPIVLVIFAASESYRSWVHYREFEGMGLFQFSAVRMATYYVTALNNGAGLLAEYGYPSYSGEFVFKWLYHLPIIGDTLVPHGNVMDNYLARYGDREFNNPSGIYSIVYDIGIPFSCIIICGIGYLIGLMYRAMSEGRILGLIMYPLMYVGVLEVMRVPYFFSGRWIAILMVATVVTFLLVMREAAARKRGL